MTFILKVKGWRLKRWKDVLKDFGNATPLEGVEIVFCSLKLNKYGEEQVARSGDGIREEFQRKFLTSVNHFVTTTVFFNRPLHIWMLRSDSAYCLTCSNGYDVTSLVHWWRSCSMDFRARAHAGIGNARSASRNGSASNLSKRWAWRHNLKKSRVSHEDCLSFPSPKYSSPPLADGQVVSAVTNDESCNVLKRYPVLVFVLFVTKGKVTNRPIGLTFFIVCTCHWFLNR